MSTRRLIQSLLTGLMCFALLLGACDPVPGGKLTADQKRADMEWLFTQFDSNYAFIEYKEEKFGFGYEAAKKKFMREALATKTNEEFYHVMMKFVALFRDAHTGASLTASNLPGRSRIAFLGFLGRRVGESLEVTELLPFVKGAFPVQVGDRITHIDGIPIRKYLEKHVFPYRSLGNDLSDFTGLINGAVFRDSLRYPMPTNPTARLTISSGLDASALTADFPEMSAGIQGSERDELIKRIREEIEKIKPTTREVIVPWSVKDIADYQLDLKSAKKSANGETKAIYTVTDTVDGSTFELALLDAHDDIVTVERLASFFTRAGGKRDLNQMKLDGLDQLRFTTDPARIAADADSPRETLRKERSLPANAIYVEGSDFFPGYVLPRPVIGKNGKPTGRVEMIGYIRIDTFSPQPIIDWEKGVIIKNNNDATVEGELKATLNQFAAMGVKSVVVDTIDNPGGSLSLVMRVAQAFSSKKIDPLSMQIRLNENWVGDFENMALNAPEPIRSFFRRMSSQFLDERAQGKRVSSPVPMDSIIPFELQPNMNLPKGMRFSVLVSEMNASCGDIFPEIMKVNGLADIIGTRTMGAGGNVVEYNQAPNSHLTLRQTESAVIKGDGSFLENNGVKPDLEVDVNADKASKYSNTIEVAIKHMQESCSRKLGTRK